MKLRNKKTGEVIDAGCRTALNGDFWITRNGGGKPIYMNFYGSLAELNEEWEDYVSKEPLIKDEKIRRIVRALFDVWEVEDVKIDSNKYFLVTTIEALGKGLKLEIPNININGVFKLVELCGEEEE